MTTDLFLKVGNSIYTVANDNIFQAFMCGFFLGFCVDLIRPYAKIFLDGVFKKGK